MCFLLSAEVWLAARPARTCKITSRLCATSRLIWACVMTISIWLIRARRPARALGWRITSIRFSRNLCPINFHATRTEGAELVLNMQQLEKIGISGRFQYALSKTYFYGPITGGFAGDEPLVAGERIIPAFDQTHTGTAQIF